MWLIPALVTPILLYVAVIAQRRAGPAAGGLIAALPLQLAIGMTAVGFSLGDGAATALAVATTMYLPAQVAYGVVFAMVVRQRGPGTALVVGFGAYSIVVTTLSIVVGPVAVAAGLAAILVGTRLLPAPGAAGRSASAPSPFVTVAVGTMMVEAVLVLVQLAGTGAGAFLAALPVVTTTLALAAARGSRTAAADTMGGMIRGLPAYVAFALVTAVLAGAVGTGVAVVLAMALSLAVARLIWSRGSGHARWKTGASSGYSSVEGARISA
jgi:hypothetical protein